MSLAGPHLGLLAALRQEELLTDAERQRAINTLRQRRNAKAGRMLRRAQRRR